MERHDAVLQFSANLPLIVEALSKISEWKDKETSGKASVLVAALCASEFLIGLYCLSDILALTQPLSVILQGESMNLAKASKNVQSLIRVLETKRQDSEQHFEDIFRSAETMAEKLDFEIRKPRNFGRRGDYTVTDCKTYYRVAVYIPLLETIVSDLKDRFSKEVLDSFKLAMLLPQPAIALSLEEAKDVVAALAKHLALSLAVAIIDRPCCFLS